MKFTQEPPASISKPLDFERIARKLRKKPGRWASIHEDTTTRASGRVNNWRNTQDKPGRLNKLPHAFRADDGRFVFVVRSLKHGSGRSAIYASFVPNE